MPRYQRFGGGGVEVPAGPPLKILFYVDHARFLCDYSTDTLQAALEGGQLTIKVTVESRHRGARLVPELLAPFHEVWFFLRAYDGVATALGEDEIAALKVWMDGGGGVLLAGDHAEGQAPNFQGVGRLVGRCIPRARHLRVWDGEPGIKTEAADTTEIALGRRGADVLEQDALAQRLLLRPHSSGMPHPIFRDADDGIFDRLPDHGHEGRVQTTMKSKELDNAPRIANEWPKDSMEPTIIARGINWRHGRTDELMAVWDGHRVPTDAGAPNFGRIVADSSFHHYIDDNLAAIAAAGGEDWAKIQALYRNLAAWLAPRSFKTEYRDRVARAAAQHPCIMDIAQADDSEVRELGRRLLAGLLPPVWYLELADDILTELGVKRPPSPLSLGLQASLVGAYFQQWVGADNGATAYDAGQGVLARALADYEAAVESESESLEQWRKVLQPPGGGGS